MRSLADRLRVERALRGLGLGALALWIVLAAWPRRVVRPALLRGNALASALPRMTIGVMPDSLHVALDSVPDARTGSWLAAMRRAGVGVSWSGASGSALALEVFRAAEPGAGIVLLASAPQAISVVSDALGPIDTVAMARDPASVRLASVEGDVTLRSGIQPARVAVADAGTPRRVLVIGAADWESKFVIAALEESGWAVDGRLSVRPDGDVEQGGERRVALDTSRYAAVVLIDSAAAASTRGVIEFARSGGGVVLAGDANRAPGAGALLGWRARSRETAPLGTLPGDTAWRGLSRFAFDTMPERGALALEVRDGAPVVMARRHFAGRVAGIGYDQTWRWRMAGGDGALAEHRDWWSRAVAGVAKRPAVSAGATDAQAFGSAPLAGLYDALGAPLASAGALTPALPLRVFANVLALVALSALLGEWLLRRARGAR